MKTKSLIIIGSLLMVMALTGYFTYTYADGANVAVEAQTAVSPQQDGSEESGPFDAWYRDIRFGSWVNLGADAGVVLATLDTIEQAEGERANADQPDTIIEVGPGHWTYEWNQVAERAMLAAELGAEEGSDQWLHDQYIQAAIYYAIGAYPNLNSPAEQEAMANSISAYEKAGEYVDWTLEKVDVTVDGRTVPAFLHLPASEDGSPVPVVMVTGGIDVSLVEYYNYFRDYFNEAGVGMVTFDIPGTGGSTGLVLDADAEKVHQAVLDYLNSDERVESEKIAIFSSSMGGNPAVKMAVTEQERVTAVVNRCGAIHGLLDAPPEHLAALPDMTRDVFATRIGADLQDFAEIATLATPISLVNQGILTDSIVTTVPILNINTHNDPIFPPEDMLLVANNSLNGEVVFAGVAGHCPEDEAHKVVIADWLIGQLSD